MLELVVGIIASSGVIGVIICVVKWLISSIGKHTDRMIHHVDGMNESFNLQTERLLGSLQNVRREIGTVREALHEHTVEQMDVWHKVDKRLDQSDTAQSELLSRVDLLQTRMDEHLINANNNGHGQMVLDLSQKAEEPNE